jgi:hypothetical protein
VVIDHLRYELYTKTDRKEAVLFYYFDYKDQDKTESVSLEMFARSLLKQVLCAGHHVPDDVQVFYDDCSKRSATPGLDAAMRVLSTCLTSFSTVYLVLDALDEYQQNHKGLVTFLGQLKTEKGPRFKVLCTSRPHLRHLADDLKSFATFEIHPAHPDVKNYINWRLNKEWKHHEDLKAKVLEAIMGQSYNGLGTSGLPTLLLVRYQLDEILSAMIPSRALKMLENLPTKLSDAYSVTLNRIEAKNALETAYLILSWVYHTPRCMYGGIDRGFSNPDGQP